ARDPLVAEVVEPVSDVLACDTLERPIDEPRALHVSLPATPVAAHVAQASSLALVEKPPTVAAHGRLAHDRHLVLRSDDVHRIEHARRFLLGRVDADDRALPFVVPRQARDEPLSVARLDRTGSAWSPFGHVRLLFIPVLVF